MGAAMADINAPHLLGRQGSYQNADTETNPRAALTGFQTLESAGVMGMVGPASTTILNIVEPAQNAGVPVVSPFAGTTQLSESGGTWIWRTVPSDVLTGRAQAVYASQQGYTQLASAYENAQGPQSFASAVADYFESAGGTMSIQEQLEPGADSYRSQISAIQNSNPQALSLIGAMEVTTLFLRNWTQLGGDVEVLVGNDVVGPELIENLGDAAEGVVGQRGGTGPAFDGFVDQYQSVHDEEPPAFANYAYDAMNTMALAMQKGGEVSRQAIANPPGQEVQTFSAGKQALEDGNEINYVGAGTPCDFNENGDVVGPVNIVKVENGEWNQIQQLSAQELREGVQ
jgi:ABC-type branched-subunit amino acid transport system substrate-binding protein